MAIIYTSTGYIPVTLVAEVLAKFKTNYRSSDWDGTINVPSGATAIDCYETRKLESNIIDYLTVNVENFEALVPWTSGTSTVGLELEYHNGTDWQTVGPTINFDPTDWKLGTTTADFTVQSKTDNVHLVELEFPEKATNDSIENYRIKIEIDQEPNTP